MALSSNKKRRHSQNADDGKPTWGESIRNAISKASRDIAKSRSQNHEGGVASVTRMILGIIGSILRLIWTIIKVTFRTIWRALLYIFITVVAIVTIAALGLGAILVSSSSDLPTLQDYSLISMPQDATIYDVDGKVIGVISTSTRKPVAFGDISQNAKDAIVSIEDERFYNHGGVDAIGVLRSLYINFKYWASGTDAMQGASTITQQYVRNAYADIGTEQTISRKLREMAVAIEVDATMSKDDILDAYLNTIYYGNGQYGIEAASQYYFGHSAKEMTDYEAAILASIINAPSIYNPATDEGRANTAQRANLVLDKMWSLGKLSIGEEELRQLKTTNINDVIHITEKERVVNQPFYYDYVMSELRGMYTDEQITSGGWQVYTTLSVDDGDKATEIVKKIEERYGSSGVTSAIADVNVTDGSLNAFCGGTDFAASQYNTATQGKPQTGSTLKPFLYATLMTQQGYYTTDTYDHSAVNVAAEGQEEHVITSYIRDDGDSSIKNGIIQSDNAMAIHAAQNVGMGNVNDMMHACGFKGDIEDNAIAIIGGQTTGFAPLELATGYATIANQGMKRDVWCVNSITDSLGNEIYHHTDSPSKAMSKEIALQLTDAMKTAVDTRTDWYNIPFDREGGWVIAAKSGTTDDKADLWCCGFDTAHAVSVWIGGRDSRVDVPTTTPTACKEFSDYFYATHQDDPKQDFEAPQFKTEVPQVNDGETATDYAKRLSDAKLTPKLSYVKPDENHADGSIVSVTDMGQCVDRNALITVTVARENIVIPDFTGMQPAEAYNEADGLNLTFTTQYVTSGSSTPTISAQSVDAGTAVSKGTTVNLTIQIVTQKQDSTTQQIPYKESDSAYAGLQNQLNEEKQKSETLQSQLDEANKRLEQLQQDSADDSDDDNGDANKEDANTVLIPDVTGKTAASARVALEALGLTVKSKGATSSSSTVDSTSPSAGTRVSKGTTVTLVCSN